MSNGKKINILFDYPMVEAARTEENMYKID